MPVLNQLLGFVDSLSRGAATVAVVMIIALALLILGQIFASSLLGIGMEFAFEYGTYLLVLIVFAGAPHAMRTGGHIRVSLVLNRSGRSLRRMLEVFCTALALGICVYIAYALTDLAVYSFVNGSRTYLPSGTLLGYPQTLLALCCWLLALQIAARLVRCFFTEAPDVDDKSDEFEGGKL